MRIVVLLLTFSVLACANFSWAATNGAPNSVNVEDHLLTLLNQTNQSSVSVRPAPLSSTNQPQSTNTGSLGSNEILGTLDNTHKLVIGDCLSFRIVEDEEDHKSMIVTDSGEVEVPYIGRFPAEGKTCRQLAAGIKAALEKDYYYEATVIIAVDLMAKTRGRIYLTGALRAPGPQEMLSDETLTLSKAILRSGGFADFADKKNVKITRKTGPNENDTQSFKIDVGQILDGGKVENDVPLVPGDLIQVPDRKLRF